MKKSTLLFATFPIILFGCGPNEDPLKMNEKNPTELKSDTDNPWTGSWIFNDGSVDYSIEISEDYGGAHRCIYTATGIQSYYVLECVGLVRGNSLKLINPTVKEGDLLEKNRIGINDPILTLTIQKDGRILTDWNRLNNNYPDNHDGKVCFVKQPKKPKKAVKDFDKIIRNLRKHDSFNQASSWEERGLNPSGQEIIKMMNKAKSNFLKEIQVIKDNYSTEEERLEQLNKLVDELPWDELDTEEREFLADELSPAIEALGFDPVIIFN